MNERFIKLLNLTQSSNDSEALSAIRMANAMLKKAGKQWSDVISSSSQNGTFDPFAGFGSGVVMDLWAQVAEEIRRTQRTAAEPHKQPPPYSEMKANQDAYERGRRTDIIDKIKSLHGRGMNAEWMDILWVQATNPKQAIDEKLEELLDKTYASAPNPR